MSRHVRRTAMRTAGYTAVAILLAADSAIVAVVAGRDRSAWLLVGSVALGYFAVVALGSAASFGISAAWSAGKTAWTLRGVEPSPGRTRSPGYTPGRVRPFAAEAHQPESSAEAANARVANAWQQRFSVSVVDGAGTQGPDGIPFAMPPTLPMPVEELAAAAGNVAGGGL